MSELRDRAAGKEVAQNNQSGDLASLIRKMKPQFEMAMPKGVEAAQLVRDALTLLRETPKLANCRAETVLGGLMTCAQLGLRPGVLGQAYLIPFKGQAQLVIGYQGLADLAYRSSQVGGIIARVVYAMDSFEVVYGTEDKIYHRPNLTGARGEPIAYYAVCHIRGGSSIFEVMTKPEVEEHRDKYALARNTDGQIVGPWVTQFDSMAKKTCLRQLSKWMPKSVELQQALAVDGGFRTGLEGSPEATTYHVEQVQPESTDG